MNVWWCNQRTGWKNEYPDRVVRASEDTPNPTFRKTVGEARAGDVVIHYRNSHVEAISRAEEDARHEEHLPRDYGAGWEFRTEYYRLNEAIHRDAFRFEVPVPPIKGLALDVNRKVNVGYFFRFSTEGLAILLANVSPAERLPAWLRGGGTVEPPLGEEQETRLKEGARYTTHLKRERNRRLADEAKRIHGHVCRVCDFDFERFYGANGAGYIEAHHVVPFHTIPEDAEVTLSPKDDFAVVCANCHRMLHLRPFPSVDALQAAVQERRPSNSDS